MAEPDTRRWALRDADGAVRNTNVPTAMLAQWAGQGAILPGFTISADGETWVPAETLPELAKRFGRSEGYLSRYIRRETGKTFRFLLKEFRMKQAVQMIENSSCSIEEVAAAVGYADISCFYSDSVGDSLAFPTAHFEYEMILVTSGRASVTINSRSYLLEADLPGFTKEDIDLHLQDGVLTITAKHQEETQEGEGGKYICRERRTGSFARSFDVSGIREEAISASYDNGVLKLVLPKQGEEQPQSRKIAIQ